MNRAVARSADEKDVVSRRWRRLKFWNPGEKSKIKKGMRRRDRRQTRRALREGRDDA